MTTPPLVEVALNAINLRRGPGTNYAQVGSLSQGESAEVLSRFGEGDSAWFEVRAGDGLVGWLSVTAVVFALLLVWEQIPTAASIPATSTPTPTATATSTPVPILTETPS
ncbi:MAG: SH3 domain-containing protein [Chloroflexota bacterium]